MIPLVIMGRPLLSNPYRERLKKAGMNPNDPSLKPRAESVMAVCWGCGHHIWLAPYQQDQLLATMSADEEIQVKLECPVCHLRGVDSPKNAPISVSS